MSRIGGVVVAGVLAVGGIGAYEKWGKGGEDNTVRGQTGEIVEQGDLGVFVMSIGDCFDAESGEIATTIGIPCSSSHENEYAAEYLLTTDVFPGRDVLSSQSEEQCLPLVSSYIGDLDKAVAKYPNLSWTSIVPTEVSFAAGDRKVSCVIGLSDGARLTESLRNF